MRTRTRLTSALAAIALAAGLTLAGTGTAGAASGWDEIYNPYLHAQGNTLCFNDPVFDGAQDSYGGVGLAAPGMPMRVWRAGG